MRRDQFIKSVLALAAGSSLSLPSLAAANIKMMIPANPGGGWDTTGRALGKALQDSGVASSVTYENKGGAAGIIGLAQYANATKGDGNSLMVMGAVMLGGIITGKPPVSLDKVTPIARLTSEYNVFVVPANSPLKTMKDVVEQLKKDPGSVKWGGGSRGSTEHIAAAMLAREVGVDAAKINYVPFRGGGEAVAAILGGNVTVGGSGYSEFSEHIKSGKMRPIGVTSEKRLPGIDIPTLKELGYPNYVNYTWTTLYVRSETPEPVTQKLVETLQKIMATQGTKDYIRSIGSDPLNLQANEMRQFQRSETERFKRIADGAGIRPQ